MGLGYESINVQICNFPPDIDVGEKPQCVEVLVVSLASHGRTISMASKSQF